jgi:hypothetical protein
LRRTIIPYTEDEIQILEHVLVMVVIEDHIQEVVDLGWTFLTLCVYINLFLTSWNKHVDNRF